MKEVEGICPICNKQIDYLTFVPDSRYYTVTAEDGDLVYDNYDTRTPDGVFRCPECDKVVTSEEDEALEILETEIEE